MYVNFIESWSLYVSCVSSVSVLSGLQQLNERIRRSPVIITQSHRHEFDPPPACRCSRCGDRTLYNPTMFGVCRGD